MGGPPSGTRSTLGRAALTGGGEHRAVGRTWAAAADSDLLWAPLPADDIFTLESAGRCEQPAARPCHHTNQPLTRGMLPRAEILMFRPRLDKLSARCSGPSKPSHISIARRRRCVEPWGPLRASHVCSPSRASHPPWPRARGRARLCAPYPEQSGQPAFGHTPYPGLPHHRKTAIPLPRAVRGASHTIAGFTTLP